MTICRQGRYHLFTNIYAIVQTLHFQLHNRAHTMIIQTERQSMSPRPKLDDLLKISPKMMIHRENSQFL